MPYSTQNFLKNLLENGSFFQSKRVMQEVYFHKHMKYTVFFIICKLFCFCEEAPSIQKLDLSFHILEENFSFDNRNRSNLILNDHLLPLAEKTVEHALTSYPDQAELMVKSIRTLYVEGNYYLRVEKFAKAQKKLFLAKQLCEKNLKGQDLDPLEICTELAKVSKELPSYYAFILSLIAQIPIYYDRSPLDLELAEKYMKQAINIRAVIDLNKNEFMNGKDCNLSVSDAVIFKRILSFIFFERNKYKEAEELCLSLLAVNDAYHQLITSKELIKIYQTKGRLSNGLERQLHYENAHKYASFCLDILDKNDAFKNHTRVTSIYISIGCLFGDEENPFQDLQEAERFLELGKIFCPSNLNATMGTVQEKFGHILNKRAKRELQEAIHVLWNFQESEHAECIKSLDSNEVHLKSYEKLGDLFLEQKRYLDASACYSNGLSLAIKTSQEATWQPRFCYKLALTEYQLLKVNKNSFNPEAFTNAITSYKNTLEEIRRAAQIDLDHNDIEQIYNNVLKNYKALLTRIFEDLCHLIGDPPLENYAFIAFGSIGRGCVTPYSDLESAILIKDEKDRDYFAVLSQLFCIRISALGESPIAGFNIESMHWLTREDGPADKGLRLDPVTMNGIVPHLKLKDQIELINTPQALARVFTDEINLPLPLKAAFYSATLIHGSTKLLNEYYREVELYLNGADRRWDLCKEIIMHDFEQYFDQLGQKFNQNNFYSVKADLYRPMTCLIDFFAMQYALHPKTPWELFRQLNEKKLSHDLKELFDKITALQLKTYLGYGKQNVLIYLNRSDDMTKQFEDEQKLLSLIKDIIDLQKIVREKIQ
jgi:hypothetical protein